MHVIQKMIPVVAILSLMGCRDTDSTDVVDSVIREYDSSIVGNWVTTGMNSNGIFWEFATEYSLPDSVKSEGKFLGWTDGTDTILASAKVAFRAKLESLNVDVLDSNTFAVKKVSGNWYTYDKKVYGENLTTLYAPKDSVRDARTVATYSLRGDTLISHDIASDDTLTFIRSK